MKYVGLHLSKIMVQNFELSKGSFKRPQFKKNFKSVQPLDLCLQGLNIQRFC